MITLFVNFLFMQIVRKKKKIAKERKNTKVSTSYNKLNIKAAYTYITYTQSDLCYNI